MSLICVVTSFAQSVEIELNRAAEAISVGNVAAAKAILQKILTAAPRDATAQTLAGIVADKENDLPRAERHFAAAVKLSPLSADFRNNYGAILQKLKRPVDAQKEFEVALKINPNQRSAMINLAQIRFDAKTKIDLTKARELFEKAKTIESDPNISRALILIYVKLNETAKAAAEYAEYKAQSSNFQIDAKLRGEIGAVLFAAKLNDEAVSELSEAVGLDASNVENLVLLSRALLEKKDIKSAGLALESAVSRGVEDARIYAALSEVYKFGGYYENAIPAMSLAIEKDRTNESYRVRYGLLLNDMGAPAAAIIRLTEASKEFPHSVQIRVALGIAQQADGKSIDAQKSFENALSIDPKSIPALGYLAIIAAEKALLNEAAALYRRALAVEEKNAVLHYLLGETLFKIAGADDAEIEKHLRLAIEVDEQLPGAHLALGRLYARVERWRDAAAEFEKAVKYEPLLAEAHYQYGRVLARLKRTEESRAALAEFKKLSESQAAAREVTRKDLVRRLANTRF